MSELDEVVREFLVESHEGLDRLDRDLVTLEQRPGDRELLAAIFRCIHTIKGTCGFLAFTKLEGVSHVGESLLSLLRDGRLSLTPAITSALLQLVDAVRQILGCIEADGGEGEVDYSALIDRLTELQQPSSAEPAESSTGTPAPDTAPAVPGPSEPAGHAPPPAVQAGAGAAERVERAEPAPAPAAVSGPAAPVSEASNIRVDVGLLDRLMNLVGELVLARNQVLQFSGRLDDAAFQSTTQRLNLITTELQEGVMKTRMQPIGNVWSKFPRVVRDLALACGKQASLDMEGKDTELDKTIIEAIKDPLTHIVRNAVDHGIESPGVRLAAGKPAEGRLRLRAYHEGGQVNIEIADDGGGIHADRVRQKALERGLITPEQAGRMPEREIYGLVFLPGFSTAERVTNVSGRGVGMDVVKTNIEKIGGTVDIHSTPGQGTTLRIKIPLTLAIIPALTVTSGGDRYAIPQVSLLELVRAEQQGAGTRIERIHDVPVYRLRGNLLPLVFLDRELGVGAGPQADEAANIVVLQAGDRRFGLVVDRINDTEEIVVKPLGKRLKGIPVFAGTTIMGDGRVALILDVLGLAQSANVVSETRDRERAQAEAGAGAAAAELTTLLVLGIGESRRVAIPLSMVARLEELPVAALEHAGGREVAQYRGRILPLLRLSTALGFPPLESGSGPLQVVVYADQGHQVGLIVDCIVDIVEAAVRLERLHAGPHLLGSAVIQQRVTDLLDVGSIVQAAHPGWFEPAPSPQAA
jgi:two-component system chemotaxis sensor kinase CheA